MTVSPGSPGGASWDFVVSYAEADQAWAAWLAWQLQDAGLRVLPLAWRGSGAETGTGTGAADILREHAAQSGHVVAVLSSAYLAAIHPLWHDDSATDTMGLGRRLVPVRVEDCPRPGALGRLVSFDLFGLDVELAGEWLRKQVGLVRDSDTDDADDSDTDVDVAVGRRLVPPPFPAARQDAPPTTAAASVATPAATAVAPGTAEAPLPVAPATSTASLDDMDDSESAPLAAPVTSAASPETAVQTPAALPPRAPGRSPAVDRVTAGETGAGTAAREPGHATTLTGHKGGVRAVAFSPRIPRTTTASQAATASGPSAARPSAAQAIASRGPGSPHLEGSGTPGHGDPASQASLVTLLATGGKDATVRLWELSGADLHPRAAATVRYGRRWNQEWVRAVVFAPSGRLLAVAGDQYTTELVDVSDPDRPTVLAALVGHGGYVYAAAFDAEGSMIATGSQDRAAIVWEVTIPQTPLKRAVLAGHRGAVTGIAIAPGSRRVLTASQDATLGIWELTGEARPGRAATVTGHDGPVHALALSDDGTLLATGGKDRRVILWDASGAVPVKIVEMSGHRKAVHALAISADGRTVASSDRGGAVLLWDVTDPSRPQLAAASSGHRGEVSGVAFAPDGIHLATAGDKAVIWSLR